MHLPVPVRGHRDDLSAAAPQIADGSAVTCCVQSDYQNSIGFHEITRRKRSPVKASRISDGFRRPPVSPATGKSFPNCANTSSVVRQGGNPVRLALVETSGLPNAAKLNNQRMIGDANGEGVKASGQPARCCRLRRENKGHRSRHAEKIVSRCAGVSIESSM